MEWTHNFEINMKFIGNLKLAKWRQLKRDQNNLTNVWGMAS